MMKLICLNGLALSLALGFSVALEATPEGGALREVGVAKIDVTPTFPVRLNGYYGRNVEATNAAEHIFAKALAIGSDAEKPAILITLDNCILPRAVHDQVVAYLHKKEGIDSERIAICVSHTHTAPCLTGAAPNLFGMDIPVLDQKHIDRYTRQVVAKLEKVALNALRDRRAATLSWGQTEAGFAANRRTKGGPVDNALPFLVVTDSDGKLRAIFANYACHCTTLGGNFTQICGDWAGYAQEDLEKDHPGAIVLTAIGCGADANPAPRGTLDMAKQHGQEFTDAVNHALAFTLIPLHGKLECRTKDLELALVPPPTREQLETLAKQTNAIGYHARKNLARLDRGEKLEGEIPYLVQSWNFGDDLDMVFLTGEVVVDYSLRLKQEFDSERLWINGYANSVPGYIPSRRILKEGGYEGGGAMVYYDHPSAFAPEIEDKIIGAVHELVPATYLFDEKKAQAPPPKSPLASLATMRTRASLKIELVASEPLIESPVYIDFGADGKMWVAEMRDYPMGMDGNWKPGGVIKYLESTHHDGKYDKATVVLENVPFPTGVMPWRNGALVCAAPDIMFAETGKGAQSVETARKIFSGFFTQNYQARVNGLSYGLDNWVYGANGLLGGVIHGKSSGGEVDIRGRDFRMNPDTGTFEPVAGLTQQGRVRDDWGNWFGCDNSNPFRAYPLPDHYVRRNPYVTAPSPSVYAATGSDPNRVYAISHLLERFNEPNSANRVTSGCGLGIYRDSLFGEEYNGNAFTCEPVGNLVYRLQLKESADGVLITGARATNETADEFLASRDNWFRPVQAKTGPDGALYIVDMYRFVIEHPDWISKERLEQLDVRAGAKMGRIYRISPEGKKLRPITDLTKSSTARLVAALNTPNGTERDLVHIALVQRNNPAAVPGLIQLATKNSSPAVRIQALCVLDGMKALTPELIQTALADLDIHVRRQAIRLSEPLLKSNVAIQEAVLKLSDDAAVRYQLALSLGEWNDPRAGKALGKLAQASMDDSWIRAAVLSSAVPQTPEILKVVLATPASAHGRSQTVNELVATAVGQNNPEALGRLLPALVPNTDTPTQAWQLSMLKTLLDGFDRNRQSLANFAKSSDPEIRDAVARIVRMLADARKIANDPAAKDSAREVAIHLLGHDAENQEADLKSLGEFLKPGNSLPVQQAALDNLKYNSNSQVPGLLLANWKVLSPALRGPIIEILLSREEFTRALVEALQNRVVQVAEISAANRQRLLKHSNEGIRTQSAKVLAAGATSSRAEAMKQYADVASMAGDIAKGAVVFSKNCTPCHKLKGQGNAVGPNLAALVDKTPGDFLLAILDPNAAVEPRFLAYNIDTKDDRSLTGVVSAESSTSLTLVQPGGIQEKILRSDITEIKATGLSLMPEGFEQGISKQEMADLIAYLKAKL